MISNDIKNDAAMTYIFMYLPPRMLAVGVLSGSWVLNSGWLVLTNGEELETSS